MGNNQGVTGRVVTPGPRGSATIRATTHRGRPTAAATSTPAWPTTRATDQWLRRPAPRALSTRAPTGGCRRWTRAPARPHATGSAPGERGRAGPPASKVTVTRAAAQRSREMGSKMYGLVHRAATADGADKSGLTALTWPVVANFAVDSAMAVALANTLFFAAASGESKSKVALYLLITIAPFAVIAPLIGPALDRLQHGRRVALAMSFVLRTVLAVVLIANYDGATGSFPSWVLYPCALGMMVLSKSFQRAAQRGDPAGAAADHRPGPGELAADDVRPARRNHRRRRASPRGVEYLLQPVRDAGRVVRGGGRDGRRRGAGDAHPEVGRGHRG